MGVRPTLISPSLPVSAASIAFAIATLAAPQMATPARADEPAAPKAEPPKPEPPKHLTAKPKPKKPALPVTITVTTNSPDPPWLVRIENTGASTIRIPADMRLLSFELKTRQGPGTGPAVGTKKCAPPKAMIPASFPSQRELYLEAGEFYEEAIDPRLYCFGDAIDFLRPGSSVIPHFGFGPSFAGSKREPFAAQGTDRPEAFDALKEIVGAEVTLPQLPKAPPAVTSPSEPSPEPATRTEPPTTPTPPKRDPAARVTGESDPPPPEDEPDEPHHRHKHRHRQADRNRGDIDIYVSRTSEASAPRDVTLTIRAVNEGRRQLAAVLRGRMLQFAVEELAPDNTARRRVECAGQAAPHGIASEMVDGVRPGREVRMPLLVAEMCPRGTFPKPGLYRVTPLLDASMMGESLDLDPWLGTALALQSTLARVATAREPFYATKPKAGPYEAPPVESKAAPQSAVPANATAGGSSTKSPTSTGATPSKPAPQKY